MWAWIGRLDRLQRSFWFKVIASAALLLGSVIGVALYAAGRSGRETQLTMTVPEEPAAVPGEDPALAASRQALREARERVLRGLNSVVGRGADWTAVAVGTGVAVVLALIIVWMGLGLTYLGLALIAGLAVVPMILWGGRIVLTRSQQGAPGVLLRDLGTFLAGVVALTASFTAALQALRLLLSGPWPALAIARNVVQEAVRMKVSLVFIILLIFGMAALPELLHEGTPLRYRVQTFLQYGAGGTFWLVAIMTLFLAVGSVAFEQRDRVIWQTMSKPVAPWQYVLGKWLGVVGVAGVLLVVSASGVFLFTEYLRNQPAHGEVAPYVAAGNLAVSEDRLALESQVLAARRVVRPTVPGVDQEAMRQLVEERIARSRQTEPDLRDTPDLRARLRDEIDTERLQQHLTIEGGRSETFVFEGLEPAARAALPMTLRYKINSSGNDPQLFPRVTFYIPNGGAVVREVALGHAMTIPLSAGAVDEHGRVTLTVINGDVHADTPNPYTINFPPDGLEIYFAAGSYRANFVRVMLVLWLKLSVLAMLGVVAATFLSFPVASLVAFGIFLMAESARFLWNSLEFYASTETSGEVIWWRVLVRAVAVPVSGGLRFYADLRPSRDLVEGRLLGWETVGYAVGTLGGLTLLLLGAGVLIFRRRELAIYSGQ
ncbi:MAG TPA: ABC transporter permease subunit [Phycisphaerales bacterium]|nr:ABC transporter permease subunit [Phycisphaerales bacterium]